MNAKRILVTGASSGIGEATSQALVTRGHRVFAGVRRPEDATRLEKTLGERCTPLILDTTDPEAIANAARVLEKDGGLDGLVNNAGIVTTGPLEFLPLAELRRQFEVNVFGVIAVTQAMLPLLRRTRGRIVIVGSVAGRNALPLLGPYCASKHAIEALAPSLRMELAASGIHVTLVEPGSIRTPLWERSIRSSEELDERLATEAVGIYGTALRAMREFAAKTGSRGTSSRVVASVIVRALESPRPKRRYVTGGDARLQLALGALPMRIREPLVRRLLKLTATAS